MLDDYNQHSQDVDLLARIKKIETFIEESPHKVVPRQEIPKMPPTSNYSVSMWDSNKRLRDEQPEDEDDEDFDAIMKKYFSLKKTKNEEEDDKKSDADSDDLDFMMKPKTQDIKPLENEFKLFSLKKDAAPESKNPSKRKRNYKPDTNSSGCFILLGIKQFEEETSKKYATKKEIKEYLKKLEATLGTMEVKSWNAIDTLTKNDLIIAFKFNDEMKYSLSLAGKELADDLCCEKLTEKKSGVPSKKDSNESSNSLPSGLADNEVLFVDKTNLPQKTPQITKTVSFDSDYFNGSQSSQPSKIIKFYSQDNVQIKGQSEATRNPLYEIPEDDGYSQSFSQGPLSQGFMSQSLSRRENIMESYEQKASVAGHYAHKVMKSKSKRFK